MKMKSTFLTSEERDVLILAAPHPDGQYLDNTEISQRLGISIHRVKMLLHRTCIKLKASNRIELIQCAMKRREIRADELWSLEEITELCCALCPDILRKITFLVAEGLDHRQFPIENEHIIHMYRRQDNGLTLTNCERNVLILAGRGFTNMGISDTLTISINAVRTFLYRAYSKLGASKRGDAVTLALKRGEISPNELFSFDELLNYLAPLGIDSLKDISQRLNRNFV